MDLQTIVQAFSWDSMIWVSATLIAYLFAVWIFKYFSNSIILHPIMIGALVICCLSFISNTPLLEYKQHVTAINWLLGPVTVALAIPLFQHIKQLFSTGKEGVLVIIFGGCFAPTIALCSLMLFDFSAPLKATILTKSITTPLAADTAKIIGGIPELAAAVVVITGILGVLISKSIFKLTSCQDQRIQGLAFGTIAHAIGTARAYQLGTKTGAFATMALCVNGILTAIILPIVFLVFG